MKKEKKVLTLKTITKSNVWELQENDIFRMWEAAERDADLKDNLPHYRDIIKSAFEMEDLIVDKPEIVKKYKTRGFKVSQVKLAAGSKKKISIKKRAIVRVTDLTYENIRHISAGKLLEVIDRNFGGGWESLSQSIRDIIEAGFDISTTTLPKDRLRKKGGMYEKKVADGFEVLEITKGTWVEAIFAKEKPKVEKLKSRYDEDEDLSERDENEDLPDEQYIQEDEDEDDIYDEDKLTEESYHTTFDEEAPEDLSMAEDVADEYDG